MAREQVTFALIARAGRRAPILARVGDLLIKNGVEISRHVTPEISRRRSRDEFEESSYAISIARDIAIKSGASDLANRWTH